VELLAVELRPNKALQVTLRLWRIAPERRRYIAYE
jgi:hypothetical protein